MLLARIRADPLAADGDGGAGLEPATGNRHRGPAAGAPAGRLNVADCDRYGRADGHQLELLKPRCFHEAEIDDGGSLVAGFAGADEIVAWHQRPEYKPAVQIRRRTLGVVAPRALGNFHRRADDRPPRSRGQLIDNAGENQRSSLCGGVDGGEGLAVPMAMMALMPSPRIQPTRESLTARGPVSCLLSFQDQGVAANKRSLADQGVRSDDRSPGALECRRRMRNRQDAGGSHVFRWIAVLAVFLWIAGVAAQETVRRPFLGVTHITRSETSPRDVRMHIVTIDLTRAGHSRQGHAAGRSAGNDSANDAAVSPGGARAGGASTHISFCRFPPPILSPR